MKNKLIIFDIDGTLTKSNDADSFYYEKAILETFKLESIDNQWENYKYSTDSGMLSEIIRLKLDREIAADDIEAVKSIFIQYLESAFIDKKHCLPIDGAQSIFDKVKQLGWDTAIATGGWEKSALLKLKTAEIAHQFIPIAHSDDHMARENIIQIAIERSMKYYEKLSYSNIVYVGDKNWDKKAAENIKIDFIGIGHAFRCDKIDFRHIEDYADEKLLGHLTELG